MIWIWKKSNIISHRRIRSLNGLVWKKRRKFSRCLLFFVCGSRIVLKQVTGIADSNEPKFSTLLNSFTHLLMSHINTSACGVHLGVFLVSDWRPDAHLVNTFDQPSPTALPDTWMGLVLTGRLQMMTGQYKDTARALQFAIFLGQSHKTLCQVEIRWKSRQSPMISLFTTAAALLATYSFRKTTTNLLMHSISIHSFLFFSTVKLDASGRDMQIEWQQLRPSDRSSATCKNKMDGSDSALSRTCARLDLNYIEKPAR